MLVSSSTVIVLDDVGNISPPAKEAPSYYSSVVGSMPLSFLALALALVLVLCFATEVGSVQQTDACIALNFRAAALQGSDDACILLRTIVGSGGDILAGDATDVDASCAVGGGANNRTTTTPRDQQCVDDVIEVVDGIAREGCEITGG